MSKPTTKHFILALGLVVLASSLFLGCSKGSDADSKNTTGSKKL
ncbi:MAG: hypothetical protein VB127_11095 [Sphaerochaeta sp.]|nr:hypothetical protein [Sphaerochaeta sp.]